MQPQRLVVRGDLIHLEIDVGGEGVLPPDGSNTAKAVQRAHVHGVPTSHCPANMERIR